MEIAIPTIGTRGDVQPFIALAQGLVAAGHSVTLLSHPVMGELVRSHGVQFAPVGPDVDLGVETAVIRDRSGIVLVGVMRAMQFSFDMLKRSHQDILAGCRGADLVVYSTQSAAGRNEADLLGIPAVSVQLMPWAIPVDDPGRPLYKRLGYGAMDQAVSLITTRPLNRLRREIGLAPVGAEGFASRHLNLVPVSPLVFEPNPGWATRNRQVGYWFADEPGDWQPDADLVSFLEGGEPPLVVSLGAMSLGGSSKARETAAMFIDVLQRLGIRAIVQGWDELLDQAALPQCLFKAGSIPHSWLLRRAAGLVHHGGFGTTAAGFRAGIPQLVIPHLVDQYSWGQHVHRLGVGPAPIARQRLEPEKLAAGLEELLGNPELAVAASQLGEGIRTEQGVQAAVGLIESLESDLPGMS